MGPLPAQKSGEINLKRILGHRSWHINRKHHHLVKTLDSLKADVKKQNIDHYCVTGDTTNLGLESEFKRTKDWLLDLGAPNTISLTPGNHDAYGSNYRRDLKEYWSEFGCDAFPYVHKRGPVAIIGISSAVPTAPFFANGYVDDMQCEALAKILQETKDEGLIRIIMLHHPPKPSRTRPRKALWKPEKLHDVLAQHGAELILHGHTHKRMIYDLNGIPVLDCGSSSYGSGDETHMGHYNIIEICEKNSIVIYNRIYDQKTGHFIKNGKEGL
jgi:3',5'-cyclic AMP phosphodiesterase CpdA